MLFASSLPLLHSTPFRCVISCLVLFWGGVIEGVVTCVALLQLVELQEFPAIEWQTVLFCLCVNLFTSLRVCVCVCECMFGIVRVCVCASFINVSNIWWSIFYLAEQTTSTEMSLLAFRLWCQFKLYSIPCT